MWRVGALLLTRLGPPCAWPHPQPPVFQEPSYLDDLSNASIFSSSLDSLSDIVDTPDFLPADRLSQVPTIWDVSTGPPAHNKVSAPSVAVWTPRGCGAPHPFYITSIMARYPAAASVLSLLGRRASPDVRCYFCC